MMKEIKEVSEMDKKKYYITTAIAYTSGKPHIGNTYEAVLADSILMRRFWRIVLPGLRDSRDMMCFSRQERMSMDRRSS